MDDLKHEIVADIKRVASELGRAPTRDEYHRQKLGRFSEKQIRGAFVVGGFTEACLAAGFSRAKHKPSAAEKSVLREYSSYDIQRKIHTSFETELLPYATKYECRRDKKNPLMIGAGDGHSPFFHRFSLEVMLDTILRAGPDIVVLDGDWADFYPLSDYNQDPARLNSLEKEISILKKRVFEAIRQAAPNAQIDYIMGNHEWRLWKYLVSRAPALAHLSCLSLPKLFGLDDYGINLVARRTLINPKPSKKEDNFKRYGSELQFVWAHGKSTGTFCAMEELKKYGRSGCSGHVHRHVQATLRDLDGAKTWTSLGCMAQDRVGEEYQDDLIRQQRGFALVHLLNGTSATEYIATDNGVAVVGGQRYFEKDFPGEIQGISGSGENPEE